MATRKTTKPAVKVEPAAPKIETVTAAPVETARACRPFTLAEGVQIILSGILSAMAMVKTGAAGWWYMHAKDGKFGAGGTRYTHRYAVVDSVGEPLPDGTKPVGSIRFVGLTFDENGVYDPNASASWTPSTRDPAHAPNVKVDGTRNVKGLDSTAGNGGPAPQCADTRGAIITLHPNSGTDDAPCMVITGSKGGAYALSGIILPDGTPVA